jgi:hypothetical protein
MHAAYHLTVLLAGELCQGNARSADGLCELHGRTARCADRFGQHRDQQSVVQRVFGQARHRFSHRQLVVLMLPARINMNGITNGTMASRTSVLMIGIHVITIRLTQIYQMPGLIIVIGGISDEWHRFCNLHPGRFAPCNYGLL